jgi:hypothetical protein
MEKYPEIGERLLKFLEARSEVTAAIHDPRRLGVAGRRLASILDETKLRRVLAKMLDEKEFLSPYGAPRRASNLGLRVPGILVWSSPGDFEESQRN